MDFPLPPGGFSINTTVYRGVGRPVSGDSNMPLVLAIPPGESCPELWHTSVDYIVPTAGVDRFATSFSTRYGFDAAAFLAAPEEDSSASKSEPEVKAKAADGKKQKT
jgi:hypothetical protein